MNWTLAVQLPTLVLALWLFTSYMTRTFPTLTGKRICLLIAHPDDEAMFFAPALLSLTRPELGNQLVILCLSSGDADGLGHVRKGELAKSAVLLGLRSAEQVVVVEDAEKFPDSMGVDWDARLIAQTLARYFAPELSSSSRNTRSASAAASSRPPATHIDVLLTFDAQGVSGHPNHRSLYHGATAFLRQIMQGRAGWECPVKLYTLTSTNVLRKYSSLIDAPLTVLNCLFRRKEKGEFPTPLVAVSTPGEVRKAQRAMTTAHQSQMRWFRWGWIGISRYMVMNDLVKQKGF